MNAPTASSALERGLHAYGQALEQGSAGPSLARAQDRPGQMLAALYASAPYAIRAPGLPVARLSINLTASEVFGALEGDRPRSHRAERHSMFLTPALAGACWRKDVASEHINLYFLPRGDEDDGAGSVCGLLAAELPLINVTPRGTAPLIQSLVRELRCVDGFSAEAVDALGRLLLIALCRGQARAGAGHWLSAAALRRLQDHVDAHVAERLLVADLAAVVGLPAHGFADAFYRLTGRSPHQFVLARRIGRAQNLLRQTRLPIAEIAVSTGFSSQSHLTRALRERIGVTPAALRAR